MLQFIRLSVSCPQLKTVHFSVLVTIFLQCFDAVGWAAGRASGLYRTEWWGVGVAICLEQGADLHVAQLMPLPLTVSCFSKIQICFIFLVPAHPGSPGKRAVKRGVCVCVWYYRSLIGNLMLEVYFTVQRGQNCNEATIDSQVSISLVIHGL